MKRRLTAVCLALLISVSFSGCSVGGTEKNSSSEEIKLTALPTFSSESELAEFLNEQNAQNYGVTPFNDAMNYFANNATEWFELEEEQPLYANITLAWYDFFDSPNYIPILYGVTVAQTCCMNSDGDWMFGEETSYDENPGTSYVTGTIVRSVIYVNTQIQDEPDIIDNPNNTTDFPKSIHNVVRHEILHALGLRHPHEFGEPDSQEYSLMYPSCMSIYTATTLQDYDMNELRKTYPYNIWEE